MWLFDKQPVLYFLDDAYEVSVAVNLLDADWIIPFQA